MMIYSECLPSFAHQREARALSKDAVAYGYLMEQGTGKSKTLIDDLAHQFAAGRIKAAIITAPNGVQRAWAIQHLFDHVPKDLPYRAVVYQGNQTKKYQRQIGQLFDPAFEGLRILIINYESLRAKHKGAYDLIHQFLTTFQCLWALDESHRIKTWESKSTKTVIDLSDKAALRRILTGTPSTQGPMDLYPQMYFLDPTILGFPSYTAYRAHFAVLEPSDSNTMWLIKRRLIQKYGPEKAKRMMPQIIARDWQGKQIYKNLEQLQTLMAPFTYRKLKAECLDLPPKLYQRHYVDLTKEQRTLYDTLEAKYMVEYQAEFLDANMALTRLTRLQQITGGFFPTESGESLPIGTENPKLVELLEIVEDTEGKVIIWSRFKEELRAIAIALREQYGPGTVARYWGEIKQKERDEGKNEFCSPDSKRRFFVSQPQSGGTGLDGLQIARTEIYFSNDFSLLNRLQSEDRADRIGAVGSLTIIDIEAVDTKDALVIDCLRSKKDVADVITGDPSKVWI